VNEVEVKNLNGLFDLTEAAEYLKISNRALRDLCKRKAITYIRLDRYNWRFRILDLETYLVRRTVQAKAVYA
jgi:excisionase family DNA binding protein